MDFLKAVRAMKKGEKVRRKSWSKKEGVILSDLGYIIWEDVKTMPSLQLSSYEATDWEIVENNPIIVTEIFNKEGKIWTINFNKYNDESDIIVPEDIAVEILRLQSNNAKLENTEKKTLQQKLNKHVNWRVHPKVTVERHIREAISIYFEKVLKYFDNYEQHMLLKEKADEIFGKE